MLTNINRRGSEEAIAHISLRFNCTPQDLAKVILSATAKQVDPEAVDLLASLSDDEVRKTYQSIVRWALSHPHPPA